MILIDAGPLVVIAGDKSTPLHKEIRAFVLKNDDNFVTSTPAFTEAMHLAGKRGGWPMQRQLWQFWLVKVFEVAPLDDARLERSRQLMLTYASKRMDLADATLVALAETTGCRRILTIDEDFYVYRIHDREAFDVIDPLA